MKKFLGIVVLIFFCCSPSYSESDLQVETVNLICKSNDQSMIQNVTIGKFGKEKKAIGFVNQRAASIFITKATYILDFSITPSLDDGIKSTMVIDRTTGVYNEIWRIENSKSEIFIGNCKKVDPKF